MRRALAAATRAFAGFVAYAFSNALGFPLLLGGGLRYRFYNAWGLSSAEIAMIVGFNSTTFWLGVLLVGGLSFVLEPAATPAMIGLPIHSLYPLGVALLLLVAAYLFATAFVRKTFRVARLGILSSHSRARAVAIRGVEHGLAVCGIGDLGADPGDAPASDLPRLHQLFPARADRGDAQPRAGWARRLRRDFRHDHEDFVPPTGLVGILIMFRVDLLFVAARGRGAAAGRARSYAREDHVRERRAGRGIGWVPGVAPVAALGHDVHRRHDPSPFRRERRTCRAHAAAFDAGAAGGHRVFAFYRESHRRDSAGALPRSRPPARRRVVAHDARRSPLASLHRCSKASTTKKRSVLAMILAALIPARRHFYRRASLTAEMFTPAWTSMTIVALGTSIWLGFFVYQHVNYSTDLWWRFAMRGDAPRFLRATVGATSILLLVAVQRLLRPVEVEDPNRSRRSVARESQGDRARVA